MKNSDAEWIGYIPCSWEILPIHSAFVERREKVSDIEWEPLSVTKSGVVKQLEHAAKSNNHNDRKKVCVGDFAINSRSDRKESCGLSSMDGSVSLINTVLIANASLYSSKYVKYLLKNYGFAEEFYRWGTGIVADLWSTNFERMKNIKLPFPPLSEQQKIADFLDEKVKEIDNAIEKTKETIELYEKMKKAVIEDFVFKRKEKNAIDTGIYYIKKIPTYWGITKVKYVLDENGLKTKTGLEEPLSVSQKYGLIPTKNMDSVPLQMADYSKCKIVHKNDLVFNKLKAHLGVFYHSDYEGIVSPDYAVYQSLNINVEYLELLFKTKEYISEFIKRSTGVGQGFMRLYTEPLFSMYIPYPSIKEQKEIVNSIRQKHEEIDNLINYKEKIVNDLTCYKKSLIYEYVTGKKEVK